MGGPTRGAVRVGLDFFAPLFASRQKVENIPSERTDEKKKLSFLHKSSVSDRVT